MTAESKNLSEEELLELNIEPKYLGMSHTKACDFCDNPENKNTLVDELIIMFGYQVCENCKCKKINILTPDAIQVVNVVLIMNE